MTKRVFIVYRYVAQYRKEFFEGLKDVLDQKGIELNLIYGQPGKSGTLKADMIEIPWGVKINNSIFQIGNKELYWQPVFPYIKDADLIIVEQASKLLINYLLFVLSKVNKWKIAFWGHGYNFHKSSAIPLSEWVNRIFTTKVHWFFAFTDSSAKFLRTLGFPKDRITIVQNAIDTKHLIKARALIKDGDLIALKEQMGLQGNNTGLYIGAMYKEKKLEFLLEACRLIRQQIPDFEMLMIGSGPDVNLVKEAAIKNPWIHYLGPKFGDEKIPYFALSNVLLIPGLVGLAVLDSFSLGVPLIATQNPDNSLEIDYLVDGYNGILVQDCVNPVRYSRAVIDLLSNRKKLDELVRGCNQSAEKYTIESMVNNFANGIVEALDN